MHSPHLPLMEQLPVPGGDTTVLLLGGDARLAAALAGAGYRVERHALDKGPAAERRGVPFQPPVITWPYADAVFDAVVLLDELALTVREEEALAEAARVLRPGGLLWLRVPAAGRLAWLDGFNIYRYVWETTRRGVRPQETAAMGWRRHYRQEDVRQLLRPDFHVRVMTGAGLGLTELVRLGLFLGWSWALNSARAERTIQRVARRIARWEGCWSVLGRGSWLITAAERKPAA